MAPRLIINADDFGLTAGVNRAIAELHQAGAVTSATLMATGAAFDDAVSTACEEAVTRLESAGKDVLYDDTDERPGGKFATADLIGVPWQLTIGPKGLADGVVELKRRATGEKFTLPLDEAISRLIG